MTEPSSNPNPPENISSSSSSPSTETTNKIFSGEKVRYPNPPDPSNPDPATLREQWKYAKRQYGRMYSHAWGTAILAGVSLFALGWFVKGSNPLHHHDSPPPPPPPAEDTAEQRRG